ncbi:MAG: FecR domain-containing protein [Rikenellaceae bacterium]|nr:FecR domain-containing protein [Rikenellaceae bacterium]MCL2692748.1 FecR domain-containing protein [Rikenellaceae bacterium]
MNKIESQDRYCRTDEELEDILRTIEIMDGVDDVGLYERVGNTIRKKHLRRRRRLLLRNVAAIAVPLLLAAVGVWLYTDNPAEDGVIVRHTGIPRLIMPDGGEVVLDDTRTGHIADEIDVMLEKEDGTLLMRRKDAAIDIADMRYYGLEVPRGAKFDIVLEDGTRVWMNADSYLRYPAVFSGGERRVFVEGEAYFDVAPDAEKPFIVETNRQVLTVLGTRFNISAYKDDGVIYTTLIEGKVSLKTVGTHAEITLVPGMQARLNLDSDQFTQHKVKVADMAAWRENVIVFEGNTLEQMMTKLARIYDIEFAFEDESIKSLLTRGTMSVKNDISQILNLIEASGEARFDIKGNRINIKSAK